VSCCNNRETLAARCHQTCVAAARRRRQRQLERRVSARQLEEVQMIRFSRVALAACAAVTLLAATASAQSHTSGRFSGAKVNAGTVTHIKNNGVNVLRLSTDFKVPDTPDPHWQIVDSKGTVYLLQRLPIKDDKVNLQITVPDYVKDIAKVQIYCAWAEVVLGEASFSTTLTLDR
jgi:hypothetical protein